MWVQITQSLWLPTGADAAGRFIAIRSQGGDGVLVKEAAANGDVLDSFNTHIPVTQLVAKLNSPELSLLRTMERLLDALGAIANGR